MSQITKYADRYNIGELKQQPEQKPKSMIEKYMEGNNEKTPIIEDNSEKESEPLVNTRRGNNSWQRTKQTETE